MSKKKRRRKARSRPAASPQAAQHGGSEELPAKGRVLLGPAPASGQSRPTRAPTAGHRAPGPAPPPEQHRPTEKKPRVGQDEVASNDVLHALVELVATGGLDEHLGRLQVAIAARHRDRTRVAANEAAARLQIGDRVRISEGMRPLYLQGATGTIVGWASQNAVIELDQPTGRFSSGRLRCPPLGLHPVIE